jgi:Tat protein translocase TatB subunit
VPQVRARFLGANLGASIPFAASDAPNYDESYMNLGMPEMIFIFLLALVIFGPKELPAIGRKLGKILGEFKKASNEFKNQLETEMMNIELEERSKKPIGEIAATKPFDEARKIIPAEKLFDTISVPPMESIPRAPLPLPAEPTAVEPVVADAAPVNADLQPSTPDTPSHNA